MNPRQAALTAVAIHIAVHFADSAAVREELRDIATEVVAPLIATNDEEGDKTLAEMFDVEGFMDFIMAGSNCGLLIAYNEAGQRAIADLAEAVDEAFGPLMDTLFNPHNMN